MENSSIAPSGVLLEYAVAVADGRLRPHIENGECLITHGGEDGPVVRFDVWWFEHQILPRESKLGLVLSDSQNGGFVAGYGTDGALQHVQYSKDPKEALMRAFVWKRLGGWPNVASSPE